MSAGALWIKLLRNPQHDFVQSLTTAIIGLWMWISCSVAWRDRVAGSRCPDQALHVNPPHRSPHPGAHDIQLSDPINFSTHHPEPLARKPLRGPVSLINHI